MGFEHVFVVRSTAQTVFITCATSSTTHTQDNAAAQCKNALADPNGGTIAKQLPKGENSLLWFYPGTPEDSEEPPRQFRTDIVVQALEDKRLGFLNGAGCAQSLAVDLVNVLKQLSQKQGSKIDRASLATNGNLSTWTVKQLKEYCKRHGIRGYSNKKKAELIQIVNSHITRNSASEEKEKDDDEENHNDEDSDDEADSEPEKQFQDNKEDDMQVDVTPVITKKSKHVDE